MLKKNFFLEKIIFLILRTVFGIDNFDVSIIKGLIPRIFPIFTHFK